MATLSRSGTTLLVNNSTAAERESEGESTSLLPGYECEKGAEAMEARERRQREGGMERGEGERGENCLK